MIKKAKVKDLLIFSCIAAVVAAIAYFLFIPVDEEESIRCVCDDCDEDDEFEEENLD